jgi:hypothetical protein
VPSGILIFNFPLSVGTSILPPNAAEAKSMGTAQYKSLGGSIEVPTLNGKLKIKIPEGTQTDKQFRLKSKGITGLQGSGTGDLICQVKIASRIISASMVGLPLESRISRAWMCLIFTMCPLLISKRTSFW